MALRGIYYLTGSKNDPVSRPIGFKWENSRAPSAFKYLINEVSQWSVFGVVVCIWRDFVLNFDWILNLGPGHHSKCLESKGYLQLKSHRITNLDFYFFSEWSSISKLHLFSQLFSPHSVFAWERECIF